MRSPTALLALPLLAAAAAPRPAELAWRDARALTVEGQAFADTAAPWDRLPAQAEALVREPVWKLQRESAGICVRFVSDARELHARWTLTSEELAMPHMPATGVSGLDLYARDDAGRWRWLAVGVPRAQANEARLVAGLAAGEREYCLYLPLYNGVAALELGVPEGAELRPAPPRPDAVRRPVVFYGTSITQGGCASRPGMTHAAILGRRLDREVVNLGFSGNGMMEPELAELLGRIDAALFVVDCLPNMRAELVAERAAPFVRALRAARPDAPIVLVEDRSYQNAWLRPGAAERNANSRAALRAAFDALRAEGVPGLRTLAGDALLGADGEATVDSSHPTDLGFARQADVFEPLLRAALEGR